jgi:hypothetical protein
LEHVEREQLVGGGGCQRSVLIGCEGAETVTGLRGNDNTGAAGGDDVAELLENDRRAVEVDGEDGFRWGLAG